MTKQHPEYDSCIEGVVLSANDVIANVLLLYVDEGYAPMNIVTVSLPNSAREYREKSKDGKALFQRGDLIKIECKITQQQKQNFNERDLEEFENIIMDQDESTIELNQMDTEKQFAKYWADLEKRDLAKRQIQFQSQENQKEPQK